jgi:hypothetical protein
MSGIVYALLVGIDTYQPPVRPLSGCVNDIGTIESLLAERMVRAGTRVESLVLKNEKATRQAIIDGFLTHLLLQRPRVTASHAARILVPGTRPA